MANCFNLHSPTLSSEPPEPLRIRVPRKFTSAGLSAGLHLAGLAVLVALPSALPPPASPPMTRVTRLVEPQVSPPYIHRPPQTSPPQPAAPRAIAEQPPSTAMRVGGFDKSTGPLKAATPNAHDTGVVVGTWNPGEAPTASSSPKGVIAASALFSQDGSSSGTAGTSGRGTGGGATAASATEEPARLLSFPSPAYTEEARQLHISGEVILQIRVTASGEAQFLRLVRGLGHGLDEVAIAAVRGLVFRPARRGGVPVEAVTHMTLVFKLT